MSFTGDTLTPNLRVGVKGTVVLLAATLLLCLLLSGTARAAAPVTALANGASATAQPVGDGSEAVGLPGAQSVPAATGKASAPTAQAETHPLEKAATAMTQTTDRVAENQTKPVAGTVAPSVPGTALPVTATVVKRAAPVIDTVAKPAAPVIDSATKTAAPVIDTATKTAAPVTHALAKTAAPVIDAVSNSVARLANTPAPTIQTAEAVVAPVSDDITKGKPPFTQTATGSSAGRPVRGAASTTSDDGALTTVPFTATNGLASTSSAGAGSSEADAAIVPPLGPGDRGPSRNLEGELAEEGVLGFAQSRNGLPFRLAEMWSFAGPSSLLPTLVVGGNGDHEIGGSREGSRGLAPVPPPAPIPGGLLGGALASSSGAAISIFLALASLLVLVGSQTMRRLRLASEPWRVASFVLIPERPG